MHELDLSTVPLEGTLLIEASAGTGKTFTLAGLYLRLVLERELPVDRILVVTYTVAATEELKDRIRQRLRQAQEVFAGREEPRDELLQGLMETLEAGPALITLRRALRDFDQAAIFTIHGFCQRTLGENAFESGTAFQNEFVTEQQELVRDVVEDFWRVRFQNAPPSLAAFIMDRKFSPEALVRLAGLCLNHPRLHVEPRGRAFDDPKAEQRFQTSFAALRDQWQHCRAAVWDILRDDPGLNRQSYKITTIAQLVESMSALLQLAHPSPCLFKGFDRFTTSYMRDKTKKNHQTPDHPFFRLAQELADAAAALCDSYENQLMAAKVEFVDRFHAELSRRKQAGGLLSFDDLLILLHRAVTGASGPRLVQAVRQRFAVALVDEFQDTDPLQYEIFSRLFHAPGLGLFLIGDPKQAIYSFRGADIFAYQEAAQRVRPEQRFTLKTNYRSDPGLVEAVNILFSRHDTPFVFPWIGFVPVGSPPQADCQSSAGPDVPPGLTIWLLQNEALAPGKKSVPKGVAEQVAARSTAAEIASLLAPPAAGRGSAAPQGQAFLPVTAGDIAVLTRTHRQARIVQAELNRLTIPCVLYNSGNLFDTLEATEVHRLMQAVAGYTDMTRLRTGLATSLMGLRAGELQTLDEQPEQLERWVGRFAEYHEQWSLAGFLSGFSRLLRREDVRARLLGMDQGERRLTNVLHLMEILHQQESGAHLGMETLLAWMSRRLDPGTPRRDEHVLRLESDAEAIKIITVHKSKGLEFPIVFCPFLFESPPPVSEHLVCHDHPSGQGLVLDLGSELRDQRLDLARTEALAENVRLLYVALTRARTRCYALWGRINRAESSAAAHLLHARSGEGVAPGVSLADRIKNLDQSRFVEDVTRLDRESPSISVHAPPEVPALVSADRSGPAASPLDCRSFSRTLRNDWRFSSFSHLVRNAPGDETAWPDELWPPPAPVPAEEPTGIFAFPKGARAGVLLHEILERIDFTWPGEERIRRVVVDRLAAHGFDPSWKDVVCEMVQKVRQTPLDGNELRLSGIPLRDRLTELEFAFPLERISPAVLHSLFQDLCLAPGAVPAATAMQGLSFSPHQGMMKGFIDLVFRHRERYFLLDWKSNFLGGSTEDYHRDALARVMVSDHYLLQYHLYTLALHAYLGARLPGYDYSRHFGGVFYVFLRGVDPERGSAYGIFHDRPDQALVQRMEKTLVQPAHASGLGRLRGNAA